MGERPGGRVVVVIAAAALVVVVVNANGGSRVPCMYIFGDSLVDNGNNNGMLTLARANYRPYGIDFPDGSSGRFTNGRTIVDFIAQFLGFSWNMIPPYATSQMSSDLPRGINFASGAAGIRPETGNNLGAHYPFAEQVEHFREAVRQMARGSSRSGLGRCIYYVGMGSNDYLNNYFMPSYYSTASDYDPATFSALLLHDYSQQLMELYEIGARKFVIVGLGQIGCIPYELARNNMNSGCNDKINSAIAIYNKGLVSMVNRLNRQLSGAKFIFLNTFESSKDLVANASSYGFTVVDRGCCGVGRNNGQITCLPFQTPCEDRSKYLFWDAFHPTEAANLIYARKVYNSTSPSDVFPFNIRHLAGYLIHSTTTSPSHFKN